VKNKLLSYSAEDMAPHDDPYYLLRQ